MRYPTPPRQEPRVTALRCTTFIPGADTTSEKLLARAIFCAACDTPTAPDMSKRRNSSLLNDLLRTRAGKALLALVVLAVVVSMLTSGIDSTAYPVIYDIVWITLFGAGVWGLYALDQRLRRHRRIRVAQFNELLALTPSQFELATADLLNSIGYRGLRQIGGSGDLCADLAGYDAQGRSVVIQCKRYTPGNKIGTPEVQTFIGMMAVHHRSEVGVFVTTSAFTQPAIDLARRHQIRLIDGAQLSTLVNAGNTTQPGQLLTA